MESEPLTNFGEKNSVSGVPTGINIADWLPQEVASNRPGVSTDDAPFLPTLWRVLLELPEVAKMSKGGVKFSDMTRDIMAMSTCVGKVVGLGPLAFKDRDNGDAWGGFEHIALGDHVLIAKYSNTSKRFRMLSTDKEYVVMNDDEILGHVKNPHDVVSI